MHALLGALASVLLLVALATADEKATHPAPAPHMSECSAEASEKHLTGEARKHFLADCHRKHSTSHEKGTEMDAHAGSSTEGEHHATQGEKMKACNQDASAKNLHGDERRAFMSQCLKAGK